MIRYSRRTAVLAVAAAVASAPVISACGAGREPQTALPTQLTEGVNASVPVGDATPQVDIRNMFVLGPLPDQTIPAGAQSRVPLYGVLINQEGREDRLVRVESASFGGARLAGGAIALPASQTSGVSTPVDLNRLTAGASPTSPAATSPAAPGSPTGAAPTETPGTPGTPAVVLEAPVTGLRGGEALQLTLRFERAGSITLKVPVVPQRAEYGTYSAVPTPTPTPTPTQQPSGSPGAPSGSPSAASPGPTTSTPAG